MMNAKKKFWKERQHAVANYPHCIGGAQGPIMKYFYLFKRLITAFNKSFECDAICLL